MTHRMRTRRRALPLAMLVVALGLVAASPASAADALQGRVLLRNDGFALSPDLTLGRFGMGRLLFDRPSDVGVDAKGNVFILDAGNNRVQVLDRDGRFLSEWGLGSEDRIGWKERTALAVKRRDRTIFVLDEERARVRQYQADGTLLMAFGTGGLGSGHMDRPVDLDVDPSGHVYVLDEGRKKVLKYHRSGRFMGEWGEYGARENQFAEPVSIAYSEQGLGIVCVLDRGKPSLLYFSTDGSFTTSLDLKGILPLDDPSPPRLAVDERGVVFIVDGTGKKLIKLDLRNLSVFSLEPGGAAGGIAVDDDGRVYIPDIRAHKLLRYTLEMH